jgi:hypothetical protein
MRGIEGMTFSKRLGVIAIAVILTVVTYCAQSCFDMSEAQTVCPKHHTADCCKHETPVSSGALQTMTSFIAGAAKFLPALPLEESPQIVALLPVFHPVMSSVYSSSHLDHNALPVFSTVLRI